MEWRRPLSLLRNLNAMARKESRALLYFAHKGASVKVGNEAGDRLLSSLVSTFRGEERERTEHLSSASPQEEAALNGSRSQRNELCGFRRAFLLDFQFGDSMERYLYFKNENRAERLRFSNDH